MNKAEAKSYLNNLRLAGTITDGEYNTRIMDLDNVPTDNKYGAIKYEWLDAHNVFQTGRKTLVFDSKKEYDRAMYLVYQQEKGRIRDLTRQRVFYYTSEDKKTVLFRYIADFIYTLNTDRPEEVVEDVKGYRQGMAYQYFKLKKKLIEDRFKITIKEI